MWMMRSDICARLSSWVTMTKVCPSWLLLVLRVERTRRLVGEDDVGLVHQGTSHGHTLLLAARELVGAMGGTFLQSEEVQQLLGTFFGLRMRRAGYQRGHHDVLECREFGQQLVELEDEADVAVAERRERLVLQPQHVRPVDDDFGVIDDLLAFLWLEA